MARSTPKPLPVLYLAPRQSGLLADLLLHEAAACVAAVGHRLHVLDHPDGPVADAVARFSARHGRQPVLVVRGRIEGEDAPPDPPDDGRTRIVDIALDGTPVGAAVLTLPTRSRHLCRLLARGCDPRPGGSLPGHALVLSHHGGGAAGDGGWPGLAWALPLLLAGPGRGLLVDLQGPDSGLRRRLEAATDAPGRPAGLVSFTHTATPGPALAARLPSAAGVRWWSGEPDSARGVLGEVGTAVDTFPWTVLDVGADQDLAEGLAAEGLPVLTCSDRAGLVLATGGRAVALPFEPRRWCGPSAASWRRAARRPAALDVAARIAGALAVPDGAGTPPEAAFRPHRPGARSDVPEASTSSEAARLPENRS